MSPKRAFRSRVKPAESPNYPTLQDFDKSLERREFLKAGAGLLSVGALGGLLAACKSHQRKGTQPAVPARLDTRADASSQDNRRTHPPATEGKEHDAAVPSRPPVQPLGGEAPAPRARIDRAPRPGAPVKKKDAGTPSPPGGAPAPKARIDKHQQVPLAGGY